jgi:signal transduction histidine kinase/ActR/RegA family two-component response regulator
MGGDTGWRLSSSLYLGFGAAYVVAAGLAVLLVNAHDRRVATAEAEERAFLLLDRNRAVAQLFARELAASAPLPVGHPDASWMTSDRAVRDLDRLAAELGGRRTVSRNAALNARIPVNEADAEERAFIEATERDPALERRALVRVLDGEPWVEALHRGDRMQASCLRCHGDPLAAPAQLLAVFGRERAFGHREGDLAFAVSVRVPLADAFARANAFSLRLSAWLLGGLALLFLAQVWVERRVVLGPIARLRAGVADLVEDRGEGPLPLPLPRGRELRELTEHLNRVALELRRRRQDLQAEVARRTTQLQEEKERSDAASAALAKSEARLRLVLESGAHEEWEWDVVTGRVQGASGPRYGGPVDVDEETFRARVHPDDLPGVAAIQEALRAGRLDKVEHEFRVRQAGGRWAWLRGRGRLERDGAGRPLRLIGTITDVTERRLLGDRLAAAERLAAAGTLAAGVAHEINNPLAWVIANLTYVEEGLARLQDEREAAPPAGLQELRAALADAAGGAVRIREVVERLRQFIRPGRASPSVPVDLRAEVEAAVAMARNAIVHKARLEVELPASLPPVRGGGHQLHQVFLNLLVNAAQAVPDGASAAHRIRVAASAGDREVAVSVEDTGPGIAPEVLPHIFDPFYTTKPAGQGTGLGLSISQSIVHAAGGRIEVESARGQGATFRVVLPIAEGPAAAPTPPPAAPIPGPGEPRPRVLVVDDEADLGRALERMLGRDHEVASVASGAEALARLTAAPPVDVVVCDLMMPGADGIEVHARAVDADPRMAGRFVFLTGGAFTARARAFADVCPGPMLAKPVDPAALRKAIGEVYRRTGPAGPEADGARPPAA